MALIPSTNHHPQIQPDPGPAATNYRQASFSLNPDIQTDKLVSDASIKDCEFCVNNSDSNVNIKTSAGFYKHVAMPAFSTLSPGFSHQANGAMVSCTNIEPSLDYRGVEYNRIFWFSLRDSAGKNASITVHLHHTTRLVQVQGASILSDGVVAAVWFVKNLLVQLFLKLSSARGHDISSFNQAVLNNSFRSSDKSSLPGQDQICSHCDKSLSRKNAKPVKCFPCKSTFHTSCHRQHKCCGTPTRPQPLPRLKRKAAEISYLDTSVVEIDDDQPESAPSPSSLVQTQHNFLPPSSSSLSLLPTVSITFASPTFTSLATSFSVPTPLLSNSLPASTSLGSTLPIPWVPTSSAQSTHTPLLPPISASPSCPSVPPPTKRQRKTPAVTPDEAQKEYLKIQVNLAQTKITSQDSKIKRQEETISFLSERLRLLELGINSELVTQYFPDYVPAPATTASSSVPLPSSSPQPPIPQTAVVQPPATQAPYRHSPQSASQPSASTHTSVPTSATTSPCSCSTELVRLLETALTELSLLKKQMDNMHNGLTNVISSPNSNIPTFASPPSFPQQQAAPSTSPSHPLPMSAAQEKTSRHTQTAAHGQRQQWPSDKSRSSQGSSSLRPIRPLFLPCPWQTGSFPSGPVRNIPPFSSNPTMRHRAGSTSRTRRPKTQRRYSPNHNASAARPTLITEFNAVTGSSHPPSSLPPGPSAPAYDHSLNF